MFAKALAKVYTSSLLGNIRDTRPVLASGATSAGSPAPPEKKVKANKESEESHDDMGFGLFN